MSALEVVLIGPGYGESILINLGDDTWVVVDSCVRKGASGSAALDYLISRGVDVASEVVLVVASHWHDDHVRGLADLLEAARRARFCCSVALRGDEFRALADHVIPVPSTFSSGVDEFRKIMEILRRRGQAPSWATSSRKLLDSPAPLVSGLWALSPSDLDVERALKGFAAASVDQNAARRVPDIEPNDTAVVMLIELADGGAILLGADIEHHGSTTDRGWHGVMNDPGRPAISSSLYKVAHHGSINAHCPATWSVGEQCSKHLARRVWRQRHARAISRRARHFGRGLPCEYSLFIRPDGSA
jgi:hypothetical protein